MLNTKSGSVLKRIEGQLTPEQQAKRDEEIKKKAEADAAAKEERRKNTALLNTYASEKDIDEARARALKENEQGIKAEFLRVRAIPFTPEVTDFINKYEQVFVVEQNRDGQMKQILTVEYPEQAARFKSVAHGDGMPAAAKWVRDGILAHYAVRAMTE